MNFKLPPIMPMQGRLLNAQAQHPDEFFSGPAVAVSAWSTIPTVNGDVRIVFAEQVFNDGKHHFRTAVTMSKDAFNAFVDSLVKFQSGQVKENTNGNT